MATFWERMGGFGDGANDLLDLATLESVVILLFRDVVTMTRAKQMLGVTTDQEAEFQSLLDARPGTLIDITAWMAEVRAFVTGARTGVEAFDSIPNLVTALNILPPA